MQVRYLNNALQKFESTQVIPIQFVSFTLSVIIGSAVLYGDFERTTAEQATKFIGGCLLTFFGVFLITSGRPSEDEEEDMLSDEEGVEETINLAEQDANEPLPPGQQRHLTSDAKAPRRSSHVSFVDAVNKPLAVLAEAGTPASRTPPTATSKPSVLPSGDASEPAPLLQTPTREPHHTRSGHPGFQHALSYESAVSAGSATPIHSEPQTHPGTPSGQHLPFFNVSDGVAAPTRPTTSSASRAHSQHFAGPLFSPSPFHSTVSGLVPSTLFKDGSPTPRRPSTSKRRHSRPTLRSSLYVSQDDLNGDVCGVETSDALGRSRTADESRLFTAEGADGKDDGFRNRARSLTTTMGELLGLRGRRDTEAARAEDRERSERHDDISTERL